MVFFGTPVFSTNKTDCHDITGDDLAPGLFLKNGACHYGLLKVHHVHVDIYD
jgi:hypothetical protein